MINKTASCLAGFVVLLLIADCLAAAPEQDSEFIADDAGRLYPARVMQIVRGEETAALVAAVSAAAANGLNVSIAGRGHSQGGHSFYPGAVVLDMLGYDAIVDLDVDARLIRVQSGATWKDVQDYIHPHGLAVKVMQSSNIFTIGGSLSANVHGRDPNYGPLISTVRSFNLLQADGSIVPVSRTLRPDLFSLVIGGYGLFGVILDVELELTDNVSYEKHTVALAYTAYSDWFERTVRDNPEAGLHFARLSIVPGDSLLREMYATTYFTSDAAVETDLDNSQALENGIAKVFYGLSRRFDWGKQLRWTLQKRLVDKPGSVELISRNNAMRPPADFLEHDSNGDTDILQEYFIPAEDFVVFTDQLRATVQAHDINLLSITIRYVPADTESALPYATEDVFAFVLDVNHGLQEAEVARAQTWTRELVDAAINLGGTYYLTYQLYPSRQQIVAAYPGIDAFFARKAEYDPKLLFMNRFHAQYASEQAQ